MTVARRTPGGRRFFDRIDDQIVVDANLAELSSLAEVNVTSLKEYGFFTHAKADGKKLKFSEPTDYWLEYKARALNRFVKRSVKWSAKHAGCDQPFGAPVVQVVSAGPDRQSRP
jgi:hypothetical protein